MNPLERILGDCKSLAPGEILGAIGMGCLRGEIDIRNPGKSVISREVVAEARRFLNVQLSALEKISGIMFSKIKERVYGNSASFMNANAEGKITTEKEKVEALVEFAESYLEFIGANKKIPFIYYPSKEELRLMKKFTDPKRSTYKEIIRMSEGEKVDTCIMRPDWSLLTLPRKNGVRGQINYSVFGNTFILSYKRRKTMESMIEKTAFELCRNLGEIIRERDINSMEEEELRSRIRIFAITDLCGLRIVPTIPYQQGSLYEKVYGHIFREIKSVGEGEVRMKRSIAGKRRRAKRGGEKKQEKIRGMKGFFFTLPLPVDVSYIYRSHITEESGLEGIPDGALPEIGFQIVPMQFLLPAELSLEHCHSNYKKRKREEMKEDPRYFVVREGLMRFSLMG